MTEVDRQSGQKSVRLAAIANRLVGRRRMFWFGFGCGDGCGDEGGATERIWVQIAAVMGVMRRHFPQLPSKHGSH